MYQSELRRAVDENYYGPDYMHPVTFGSVPRHSFATRLVDHDSISSFMSGVGSFSGLKESIEIRGDEFYAYLRLGIPSQVARALKFLGHETPEALIEHPEISKMLPDSLARRAYGEYPMKFIDLCEQEGVSPAHCQQAIRRGIRDEHLDGVLNVRQLAYSFQIHVKKNKPLDGNPDRVAVPVDFIIDGTIPFDAVVGGDVPLHKILAVAHDFSNDPESPFVQRCQASPDLARKFILAIRESYRSQGVDELRDCVENHGDGVLDLVNAYLPCSKVVREDGSEDELGLESSRYIEEAVALEWDKYAVRHLLDYNGNLSLPGVKITADEIDRLRRAGVTPEVVGKQVFNGGVPVDAVIAATEDGIVSSLMSGAL